MQDKITVVIPYYQKQQGILRRAVRSALEQESSAALDVLVVDDSSPVPAQLELKELVAEFPARIRIIVQPNAGPAAARNRGLDSIAADTEYVAFLDSDDEWMAGHISNALFALAQDFDFYFADHYQLNQTVSGFERAKRVRPAEHASLSQDRPYLHRYQGDMFNQI